MSDLHFVDEGSGEPILFVHAFPLDGRMWEPQRKELGREARVIVPDLRGFGSSPADLPPATLDEHADDLARLLDGLRIERATLVGLSMGGYICFRFAARHRARLARLALADTRATPDSEETRRSRDQNIALVEADGVPALVERMLPNLLRRKAAPAVAERVREIGSSQPKHAVKAALAAMRDRPDSVPLLGSLSLPAAILVGYEDVITPRSEAAKMAELVPGSELHVLEGAGHLASLEVPDAFNASLRRLLLRPAA
jgi:pimeloyl-ACP methyl ester carboxylesterase